VKIIHNQNSSLTTGPTNSNVNLTRKQIEDTLTDHSSFQNFTDSVIISQLNAESLPRDVDLPLDELYATLIEAMKNFPTNFYYH
jgi:hypothetical protein